MDFVDVKAPVASGGRPPWEDPAWLGEAEQWIDERLAESGLRRVGAPQLRARMWAVVARVTAEPRDAGGAGSADAADAPETLWFKANPPASAFEPALVSALNTWAPEFVPSVLAVDTARAWSLTWHAGPHLSEILDEDPRPEALIPVVRGYAELQARLAGQAGELLALGLPDLRAERVATRLEELLDNPRVRGVVDTEPEEMTEAQLKELDALVPTVRRRVRELEGLGIPASLEHSDLHPNNMLGLGAQARVIDWGDSSLAHPFMTLLVLLRSTAQILDEAGRAAVREAYLRPWEEAGYGSRADLDRAARLAIGLAPVARAMVWRRVFPCFEDSPFPHAMAAGWLTRLLADDPLTVDL
jgi:hypothetical protein